MTTNSPEPSPDGLYRTIRLIRGFEERALDLVASGEIAGGIHPYIGQEAVATGVMAALRHDDLVLSNHRGHGHLLARGTDPARFMAELLGRDTGIDRGRGGSLHPSDFGVGVLGATATVGHGAGIAAGVAWAVAQDGGDRVVVSFFGDGAMTQGALLESFNLAALWRVPVVFVCENNGYATTQPVATVLAGSIVDRATASGVPAQSADGMDVLVVHAAARRAVERARRGGGPTLLEFATYRFHGHHTFEVKARLRYRDPDEVARWWRRDPLLIQTQRVDKEVRAGIDQDIDAELAEAVRFARSSPRLDPATARDYLYAHDVYTRPGTS